MVAQALKAEAVVDLADAFSSITHPDIAMMLSPSKATTGEVFMLLKVELQVQFLKKVTLKARTVRMV